jgi:hypothetical protein
MICYKDMTFCPFHTTCKHSKTCPRALTDKVQAAAEEWWGSASAPIAQFAEKPKCWGAKE